MYKPTRRQVDVGIKIKVDVPLTLKNNISTYIVEHLEEVIKQIAKEEDFGKINHHNDEDGVCIDGGWCIIEEDYEN